MSVTVGELRAVLGLDDGEFQEGMGRAETAFSGFGTRLAGAAAALGIGAILADGLSTGLDMQAGQDRVAAQLDLTAETAATAGKVAGDLYAGAWGDSLEEVQGALAAVGTHLGDLNSLTASEMEAAGRRVLDISTATGLGVEEITLAAGSAVRTGLVPDMTAAFDLITGGFQGGANQAGDFLETLNEYSGPFQRLGMDGAQMLGVINAGLENGAWNADKAADAMKEFGIRSIDGSDATKEAFQAIGLDADAMASAIAGGGPAAAQATQETLAALALIKDPVAQTAAGVALFGTQWEDLGADAVLAMGPAITAVEDFSGATDEMGDTLNDNAKTKMTEWKRQAEMLLVNFLADKVIPLVEEFGPIVAEVIGEMVDAVRGFLEDNQETIEEWVTIIGDLLGTAVEVIQTVLGVIEDIWDQWGEQIAAVVEFIMEGVVNRIKLAFEVLEGLFKVIGGVLSGDWGEAWDGIKQIFGGFVEFITEEFERWWELLKALFGGIVESIVGFFAGLPQKAVDALAAFPGLLETAGKAALQGLWDGHVAVWEEIVEWVKAIPGLVVDLLAAFPGMMETLGRMVLGAFWRAMQAVWEEVLGWALGLKDALLGAIGDASGWLYDVGKQIIQGVINGITDMARPLIDAYNGTIGQIPGVDNIPGGSLGGVSYSDLADQGLVDPTDPNYRSNIEDAIFSEFGGVNHGGGLFDPPGMEDEGLALLQRGEMVLPRGSMPPAGFTTGSHGGGPTRVEIVTRSSGAAAARHVCRLARLGG